jgi:hypothetical protein
MMGAKTGKLEGLGFPLDAEGQSPSPIVQLCCCTSEALHMSNRRLTPVSQQLHTLQINTRVTLGLHTR